MAKAVVAILWNKCRPGDHDDGGRCLAAEACPQRVLRQEAKGEPPIPLGMCRGCGTCVTACPLKAIKLM